MKKLVFPLLVSFLLVSAIFIPPVSAQEDANPYYRVETFALADGRLVDRTIISGPPKPPSGNGIERPIVALPENDPAAGTSSLTVPAFDWHFGCSATSGSMIAGYYDRNGYPNMYTGLANSGVMSLDNSVWGTWVDGVGTSYGQCPLTASRNGLDGRATRGSYDDYWVSYGSTTQDPYITNGWTQHTYGSAIGDYMKTSQSAFSNMDGSTSFYTYTSSPGQLTCDAMVAGAISDRDGTYGRKLFYEARGYTVTDCYSQKTDNNGGGFTFAMYKAEIDAGRPVMLNVEGHTMVGVGYADPSTVYLHDTWDYLTHSMTWGGSYEGMGMLSVSIVNLQPLVVDGTLSGTITDASTSLPVVGASVAVLGSGTTTSGPGGAYSFTLPAGNYNVTADSVGYQQGAANVTITSGMTTIQDFSLTPEASLTFSPLALETTVLTGTSTTLPLTLINQSASQVSYELHEQAGGFQPSASFALAVAEAASPDARHAPAGIGVTSQVSRSPGAALPASLLLSQDFEAGVVPPAGWSEEVSNPSYNWKIMATGEPHGGSYAADVEYDPGMAAQDEWLLSPEMALTQGTLSFWSYGSVYWCRDTYDNCDLNVWIVVGAVGGGDDILLGKADQTWAENFAWVQSGYDLTPYLPGGAVRIGFEYIGTDGAQAALDDIILDGEEGGLDVAWLSESPITGTLPATQSQVVDLTFDASQVSAPGTYTATLRILSNDALHPEQSVPVTMHVIEAGEQIFLPLVVKLQSASLPAAPSGLNADPASTSAINLGWTDNAGNEDSYLIERSPDGSSWSQISSRPANTTTWQDSGLSPNTPYYYRVRAHSSAGYSGYSNVDSATTFAVVEALCNGDFELGSACWTQSSSNGWTLIINSGWPSGVSPHSGSWLAYLGGDYNETSTIQQQVTVPPGSPYLAYYHWIASEDYCGYDFGKVLVNLVEMETYDLCSDENTGGWLRHTVNLSAYSGQSILLQIRAVADGTLNSNLFVDDVTFANSALAGMDSLPVFLDPGWALPRPAK